MQTKTHNQTLEIAQHYFLTHEAICEIRENLDLVKKTHYTIATYICH